METNRRPACRMRAYREETMRRFTPILLVLAPAVPGAALPAATADVSTHARPAPPPVATPGGGALAVGLVVEISTDSLKLKETSGDPREFVVSSASPDDAKRASLLLQALKHYKKGDKVAL